LITFAAQQAARRENERRFEVFVNMLPEPVEARMRTVRPEGVYVMVAGLDDLAVWVDAVEDAGVSRRDLRRSPEFEGTQVWTLTTVSGGWDDGVDVLVQVCAVGVAGEAHVLDHEVSAPAGLPSAWAAAEVSA
jgi:hypothetical protein